MVLFIVLAVWGLAHFVLPYAIISPPRRVETIGPGFLPFNFLDFPIQTYDSVSLSGTLVMPAEGTPRSLVIMVHGVAACKELFYPTAMEFSKHGVATLVFDCRAHGKSGGKYATFGYYERYDVKRVVDMLRVRFPELPIGIIGHSMGGAIALQALALDKRISFGVVESAFAELPQIVDDYGKRITKGLTPKFISKYVLWRASKIAHFDPWLVLPVRSAQAIEQPILITHGEQDGNITCEYSKKIFAACKSSQKELVIIPGAGHNNLHEVGGKAYYDKRMGFVLEKSQMKNKF